MLSAVSRVKRRRQCKPSSESRESCSCGTLASRNVSACVFALGFQRVSGFNACEKLPTEQGQCRTAHQPTKRQTNKHRPTNVDQQTQTNKRRPNQPKTNPNIDQHTRRRNQPG
eukprot:1232786-Rhodomonas_salina.6